MSVVDSRLSEIESNLSQAQDIKQLEEGVVDQNKSIEGLSWQSEVTTHGEKFGRWSALFASMICAVIHLPALALESCWPSLLGQIFSFYIAPPVVVTSHWVALVASLVCIGLNLAFLAMGAQHRRGLMPLMLAIVGSWLVVLNPVYFLLADYKYLLHTRYATDCVVAVLTIVGLVTLVCASSWNASIDKVLLRRFQEPRQRHLFSFGQHLGDHTLVDASDSEQEGGINNTTVGDGEVDDTVL